MVKKPDKDIFDYKKDLFLKEVGKSALSLGVSTPKVKFWSNYGDHFDREERAHIHIESNLICIAEHELENMDLNEIRETASHEVTHLHHLDHGPEFQETDILNKISLFELPAGTIGALPENYKPEKVKERKERPVKHKCNYHECNKRAYTQKCKYCSGYFCVDHINPREAGFGKEIKDEKSHPDMRYNDYMIKKEKRDKEKYGEALERLLGSKSSRNLSKLWDDENGFGDKILITPIEEESSDKEDISPETLKVFESKKKKKHVNKNVNSNSRFGFVLIILAIIGLIWAYNSGYIGSSKFNFMDGSKFSDIFSFGYSESEWSIKSGETHYHKFLEGEFDSKMIVKFVSSAPIDVMLVKTYEILEVNKYRDYNSYVGCSIKYESSSKINCDVTSGMIIIYNSNLEDVKYNLSLK